MNKGLRKFLALTLAGTMVFGCSLTAFASQESTGQGSYEGGELKYPALSVTLPVITDGTFDYIADPNGLIEATAHAKYPNATFSEDAQGIFFLTSEDTYTEKSAALTATNENAQDVDFTVKLEQVTAGDASITYSSTDTFEDEDTANKIYLAVTDDTTTAVLTNEAAAVLTTTVAGTPTNYEATYSDSTYGYTVKSGDLTWEDYSFYMTGALNMNATWGDDVTFPEIKVTWSYAEHTDVPTTPSVSANTIANNGGTVNITLPEGVTITEIQKSKADGTFNTLPDTYYTLTDIENGKSLTLKDVKTQYTTTSIKIIFSEGDPITVSITE